MAFAQHNRAFLAGKDEMSALLREHDWSTSALGAPEHWSPALKSVVGLMLPNKHVMFVAWGRELSFLYNDAYRPIFGQKHPWALGRPFREVWSEIWDDVEPLVRAALAGEATWSENLHLVLERNGYPEDCWFTFSYSPVYDEDGSVVGLFCAALDTTDVVLTERRLKEQAQRQRQLFEKAPGFIAVLNGPDHVFEFVNDAYIQLVGTRDYVGQPVRQILPEVESQGLFELLDTVFATGERFVANDLALTLQGATDEPSRDVVLDFIYEPIRDSDGRVTGIFVEGHDVTEAHMTKVALEKSEAYLKFALEGGQLAEVTFILPDGIVHTSAFAELLGHSPDKRLTLAEFRAQYHPEDADRVIQERASILASAQSFYEIEKRIIWPNGQVRWVYGRGGVERDDKGRAVSVTAVYLDQTDRKNAEIALQKSEARLRAVIDAAPIGLVFADPSGRIEGGTPQVEKIIGIAIIQSNSIEEYGSDYVAFHPDGRRVDSHEYPLARVLNGESDRAELEVQVALPDNSLRWVRYIAATVRDEEGSLLGGVVASLDIERDKRFAENLAKEVALAVNKLEVAQEALRQSQKMEAMGTLTGGVAHDFNNLLTPIIGGLDLVQRRGVGDERAQRMIAGALQSAERAKTLVQRLLAFARRQPLQATPVDIGTLVAGMAELVGSTTGPQIIVSFDVAGILPPALADANQIEMALLNLAVNARDAMPDGGKINIAVTEETVGSDNRANLNAGSYVCLAVSDTGSGMDAETLKRAVEPFYSTKGIGKGTGLGLSMVHGLAAQLGGGMHIDSALGEGTTVELWLPATGVAASWSTTKGFTDTLATPGLALLVDDEDLVRASTADMLVDLGYQVVEADSAKAALRALSEGLLPDIIITDHLMPDITGVELARELHNRLPGVPVLLISGYAEIDGLAPDLARLTKPFRTADLVTAITELTCETLSPRLDI